MPRPVYFTAEDVRALPDDGNRYETVHGELLVTPSPGSPHQRVIGRLHLLLGTYLARVGREDLVMSPSDVSFGPDTLVQPDLFVADCDAINRTGKWADLGPLMLAIEVQSPSSKRADRFIKRRLYQEQRVGEYWIVDIGARAVEVWTPDDVRPRVESERLEWRHPAADHPCVVDLATLFEGIPQLEA